jgi:hypothetical protein
MLMAAMTPLLGDIVRVLAASEPELELIARVRAEEDPAAALDWGKPDVVITDATGEYADRLRERVLFRYPRVRLVTLSDEGRAAHLEMLVPRRTTLRDVSSEDLLAAVLGRRPPWVQVGDETKAEGGERNEPRRDSVPGEEGRCS